MSALKDVPFVRYTGPTGDYDDECEVKQVKLKNTSRVKGLGQYFYL